MTLLSAPDGYPDCLAELKTRIRETRVRASLAINNELIGLYWRIGRDILERERLQGWGARIVDRLAADLKAEFPNARGFSSANLRYMKTFAAAWLDPEICQRVVGKLPWGQNIQLLAVKDPAIRLWYAEAALDYGWSRSVLASQIETRLHVRQGQALTNFADRLPTAMSDLAREPGDNPSIGLILCRQRNRFVVEYTLRGVATPIGVARDQLPGDRALPAELADALPVPEEWVPFCSMERRPKMTSRRDHAVPRGHSDAGS